MCFNKTKGVKFKEMQQKDQNALQTKLNGSLRISDCDRRERK